MERRRSRPRIADVAREAGVSRGLLHYYFGTKERLLVEVVRRDTELRIVMLDDHAIEVTPARYMLVVRNDDRPGLIGHVGVVLGDAGVNISDMRVGRSPSGEAASSPGTSAKRLLEGGPAAIAVAPSNLRDRDELTVARVGVIPEGRRLSRDLVQPGDKVVLSGTIGQHGMAVMLARGSLGNPWLFAELACGRSTPPTRAEILGELDWVMDRAVEHLGRERATRYLRKFYPWYAERLGGGRALQAALQTAPTLEAARELLHAGTAPEPAHAAAAR